APVSPVRPGPDARRRTAKRLLDLGVASLTLLLAGPLMLVIAICILLDDGGPVFFSQTRAGHLDRPFRLLKFRTLRVGPHDPTDPLASATRGGRILRHLGLDELPQLVNVLRGEMSLVGPRPILPSETCLYDA